MPRRLALAALLCALVLPTAAQDGGGFPSEFLAAWDDTASKTTAIAAAAGEVYGYRPGDDVRSTNEVLLHVAAANYLFGRMMGIEPPESFIMEGYETSISDPADVAAAVEASFDHIRTAVQGMEAGALDEPVEWFGGSTMTRRGVLLFLEKHASEHLGQLIAYLRVNDVAPPWSA